MSDEEKTTENPVSETTSQPESPQSPTEPAPENTGTSEPTESPLEPQEAQSEVLEPKVEIEHLPKTQDNEQNKDQIESRVESENKALEPSASTEVPESADTISPPPETAQIPEDEPLPKPELKTPEPEIQTKQEKAEPAKEPPEEEEKTEPEPEKEDIPKISYIKSQKLGELIVMARNAIQFRKKKKLAKIMTLFLKKKNITNDEVEKLLHVSDATATRYLSQLEKEGRIKQNGRTGAGVSYSRI